MLNASTLPHINRLQGEHQRLAKLHDRISKPEGLQIALQETTRGDRSEPLVILRGNDFSDGLRDECRRHIEAMLQRLAAELRDLGVEVNG
jgi:hypothetical protein